LRIKKVLFALALILPYCVATQTLLAQAPAGDPKLTEVWQPVPKVVTPGATDAAPPSDAIVLFDGTNLDQWVRELP
jgi:hypothetical protein